MQVLNLRILADDYEQAQRSRIARGEQIRAIVQGRDQQEGGVYLSGLGFHPVTRPRPSDPDGDPKVVKTAADVLLEAIKKGDTDEPSRYLAKTYRQDWERERMAFAEMGGVLDNHPAWEWMQQVRGVGPTLGAKLLSRLDLDRAHNSSSFMAYCGLGTVPGQRWECQECGWVGIFPKSHKITGKHKRCKQLAALTHVNPEGVGRDDLVDGRTVAIIGGGLLVDDINDALQQSSLNIGVSLYLTDDPTNHSCVIYLIDGPDSFDDQETFEEVHDLASKVPVIVFAEEELTGEAIGEGLRAGAKECLWDDPGAYVELIRVVSRYTGGSPSPFDGVQFADIRAAQPRAERGQKRSYDAYAKKVCYLLATSWLKAGSRSYYGNVYREKRAYYEEQRPGWEDGRRHYAALRTAEKVFLSNLYEAWCKAMGRTPVDPYVKTELGHEVVSPEEVLEWERRQAA